MSENRSEDTQSPAATTPVAVTGADGFIGSHLVEAPGRPRPPGARDGAVQLASPPAAGWNSLRPDVLAQVEVVLGDVRDPGSVRDLVEGAEAVYHLAALIAIPYSYRAPHSYVDTNVTGTLNVLEAVRDLEIAAPGAHLHQRDVRHRADRADHRGPPHQQAQSPYAASKAGGDRLADSYHASFGTPVVTLRPFNTFGPRQSMRAVIPTVDRPGRGR